MRRSSCVHPPHAMRRVRGRIQARCRSWIMGRARACAASAHMGTSNGKDGCGLSDGLLPRERVGLLPARRGPVDGVARDPAHRRTARHRRRRHAARGLETRSQDRIPSVRQTPGAPAAQSEAARGAEKNEPANFLAPLPPPVACATLRPPQAPAPPKNLLRPATRNLMNKAVHDQRRPQENERSVNDVMATFCQRCVAAAPDARPTRGHLHGPRPIVPPLLRQTKTAPAHSHRGRHPNFALRRALLLLHDHVAGRVAGLHAEEHFVLLLQLLARVDRLLGGGDPLAVDLEDHVALLQAGRGGEGIRVDRP